MTVEELEAIITLTAYVEDEEVRDHPQYMGPSRSDAMDALHVLRAEWAQREQGEN